MISGFRHEIDDNCALLGCYAASSGNPLTTFRDNLYIIKMEWVGCPETSVRKYHFSLRNSQEDCSSHQLDTWLQCFYSYIKKTEIEFKGHNILHFMSVHDIKKYAYETLYWYTLWIVTYNTELFGMCSRF